MATERKGLMGSSTKRQQTAAKRAREQALRERRELKKEKKAAAAEARRAAGTDGALSPDAIDDEAEPSALAAVELVAAADRAP